MIARFRLTARVAVVATALAVSRRHAVHALLYLVVSLLAVAFSFFLLGAPFAAALEVIIYAGAIMVLFVFVVMMLGLGPGARPEEPRHPDRWLGPALLGAVLLGELVYVLTLGPRSVEIAAEVGPKAVGTALWGPYLLGVELVGLLLLAGLVGAYHLVRRPPGKEKT